MWSTRQCRHWLEPFAKVAQAASFWRLLDDQVAGVRPAAEAPRASYRWAGVMKGGVGECLQYRLVIEPRAARRARHVVGSLPEGWRLGGLVDDVVSCVSELVANVYEHTAKSASAELCVSWVPGSSLTVEVRDQDSRMPRRRRTADLGVLPFALIDTDADDWRIMELAEAGRASPWWTRCATALPGSPTRAAARWSAATGGSRPPRTLLATHPQPQISGKRCAWGVKGRVRG